MDRYAASRGLRKWHLSPWPGKHEKCDLKGCQEPDKVNDNSYRIAQSNKEMNNCCGSGKTSEDAAMRRPFT